MKKSIQLKELLSRAAKVRQEVTGAIVEDHRQGVHTSANLGGMVEVFDEMTAIISRLEDYEGEQNFVEAKLASDGKGHIKISASDKRDAARKLLRLSTILNDQAEEMLRDIVFVGGDDKQEARDRENTADRMLIDDLIKLVPESGPW